MFELTGFIVILVGTALAIWVNDCTPLGGKELQLTQSNAYLRESSSLIAISPAPRQDRH